MYVNSYVYTCLYKCEKVRIHKNNTYEQLTLCIWICKNNTVSYILRKYMFVYAYVCPYQNILMYIYVYMYMDMYVYVYVYAWYMMHTSMIENVYMTYEFNS